MTFKDQIASLTPAQRALFEKRLRERPAQRRASQDIVRAEDRSEAPVSFAQQRLWFLDQLHPGNPSYNMVRAYRVQGRLDPAVLRRALSAVVARHEALRTTFTEVDGSPVQRIAPEQKVDLPVADARRGAAPVPEEEIEGWMAAEARRPFDLARGPLFRAALLQTGEDDHVLLLTMHHIVSDGWSLGIVASELAGFYREFSGGSQARLPKLPVQYADFARWQREWLDGERIEKELAYWRSQLADLPVLVLPTDRPRPVEQSFRGGRHRVTFPGEIAEGLEKVARREGATLYMALLAAFQTLLYRYTGQEDIVVGSPIANRTRGELEGLIGFFVNTLVLRTDLSGEPTFRELLRRAREVSLGAYAHQDVPFEKVVEEIQPDRDLGQNPLFQVTLALQNAPALALELPGLSLTALGVENRTTRFDLEVHLWQAEGRLAASFVYATDLFDAATIERMAGHFQMLLESIVEDPDRRISELSLLPAQERQLVVHEWNRTATDYPRNATVHSLVEEHAARAPDAVAVLFGDGRMTYRRLNERANRLAHHLRGRGVGPGSAVGLCVERSFDMVVGVLGILKAGAAYLPLEPAYPRPRLEFMLRDAGARVVITQASLDEALSEGAFERIRIDADWPEIERESGENPGGGAGPEDLAYVIYTSGSTGTPKGVCIPHRAVVRLVRDTNYASFGPDEVFLQFAAISFDASTFEIWGALGNGGRLAVMPPGLPSLEELAGAIRRYEVSTLWLTAGLFHQMVDTNLPGLRGVRQLLAGGDVLSVPHVERVLRELPDCRLINGYGPTENTTFTCCHTIQPEDLARGTVPIGRPISNTRVYLLDRAGQPIPIGVAGELLIGGDGLAREYLGQPELTAAKFIPSPFGAGRERLYRTGDRARHRADGAIEFLGRIDEQVKIRGFRIEPGEIEATLAQHPSVAASVVVAREDTPGDKRLVAYVVPSAGEASAAQDPAASDAGATDQVSQWRTLYEQLYSPTDAQDPTFNTIGWDSSYTGQPLPAEDMREWVDATVERILSLDPRNVLEIGCGTGLLLFRIAPRCARYVGTDFSPRVVEQLRELVSRPGVSLPQVEVLAKSAEDFEGIPRAAFDVVVVNSVVQYFPGVEYLLSVIEGAVASVRDGGAIFLGDVRSLPLLEAFHLSVELERAPASLPIEDLRRRVRRAMAEEDELVIDPALFAALRRQFPRIGHVEVLPKSGRRDNELNRYRYDVILRVGPVKAEELRDWRDWRKESLTEEDLRAALAEQPRVLALSSVRNARISADVRALEILSGGEPPQTAGELRAAAAASAPAGAHPGDLRVWNALESYRLDTSWLAGDRSGDFDLAARRREHDATEAPVRFPERAESRPWRSYANNPLQGAVARRLIPRLRQHVKEKLPDYMVPSAFVVLDELPLTPNGKVDRKALPTPDFSAAAREGDAGFVAPADPIEEVLAGIWAQVLGLERVGASDDFFALGGHSLLATQVISRIREAFHVELPLRALFEAPTVAALARKVSAETDVTAGGAARLQPVEEKGLRVLSFAQQRLWFLDQLEPGNAFYITTRILRVTGDLNVKALESAFHSILVRHEALRTRFESREGQPFQRVEPAAPFVLAVEDFRALPPSERETAALRRGSAEAARPFDLTSAPLLRAMVLRLSEREHLLVIAMHHIVSDGWSMGILVRELAAFYEEAALGRPAQLEPLAVQYADFAHWQRAWFTGGVLDRQLAYWKKQLSNLPVLELPTDRARPAAQSFRGARHTLVLPRGLADDLRALARNEGATLYMALLAAFQTLLMRYSGQEDIVVGSPIAGRNQSEIEGLIGFFINTLVLRTDLSGDPTFRELLGRVKEVALGAYAHQDFPFEKLVEELHPDRNLASNPLFQVMFALQNAPGSAFELEGLRVTPLPLDAGTARFDLEVHVWEKPGGLSCSFVYATDLFDPQRIARMASHFQALLEDAVNDPDARVSDLSIMTEGERRQVVEEWNRTDAPYPSGKTIHALIAERAARTPEKTAVVSAAGRLTYRELNERSNRLAEYLSRRGVGREVLVGLCLERSLDMIVGLLGILKAGGAYVPLDPAYPPQRIAFTLADAKVPVLVTQESLLPALPEGDFERVCLDSDWPAIASESAADLPERSSPDSLAYVIYTSGSTGVPKGVAIEHRNAVALISWIQDAFSSEELDGVLASTSICFDLSVFELFGTLGSGGKVVLAANALDLPRAASEEEVRLVNTVPSAIAELLRAGQLPESILTVNLAGEPLMPSLVDEILRKSSARSVFDLYGPSEDTTYSTCARRLPDGPATIGRPIANKRSYILDRHRQPVPIGVAGDLYVAGAGVARGYLNRPEQTAERFLDDPFRPGQRMYATGDRARFLSDGNIQFLGRLDHQVKIRGYRIELGEIEAVLRRQPGILDVAVVAREHAGGKRLVAYVVPGAAASEPGDPTTLPSRLRSALKEVFPDYMIPSAILVLDALPLTPSGKLDRAALPEPDARPDLESAFVPPRNPVEEVLAGIWAHVLSVDRVGAFDDFFALGGHSLLATRVVSRLRAAFQIDLPLRALFEAPTVEALARRISTARSEQTGDAMVAIRPAPRDRELELSFGQQRLWFLDQLEPGKSFYSLSRMVRLAGDLDVGALQRALTSLVSRHEALRTRFVSREGRPIQVIEPAAEFQVPITDLADLPEDRRREEAIRRGTEDAARPFDLTSAPLLRARLFRLSPREHALLLTMHHIVSDGWSMAILIRELTALYGEARGQGRANLERLPLQFADFAQWQREWLRGEVLERQVGYWKNQLADLPVMELPTDRAHPAVRNYRGARRSMSFPRGLSAGLRELTRREGVTIYMTLLAAFQTLLLRYTGQEDVVVGSPIAGRNREEVEGLIGFFVNNLVMRTDLSGNPTFREAVGRVKAVALAAYAHQDLPFEKLVEELQPHRDLSQNPLFQVLFAVQNAPTSSFDLGGLMVESLPLEGKSVRFDLEAFIHETDDSMSFTLIAATDLFDEETLARMGGHFEKLLESIVADPDTRIRELDLLPEEERRQVTEEWNRTDAPYPERQTIHGLFEEQARRTPDRVAVVCGRERLTYSQLNERANRLASYLSRRSARAEVLVGLCVERSLDMVVGLLGILKSGAAYLPLDPAYPKQRLAFMIEDSRAPLVLTQASVADVLPAGAFDRIRLDTDWPAIAGESGDDFRGSAGPASLAYVIYTSGSTGTPKGVAIEHHSTVALTAWARGRFSEAELGGVLASTSVCFDLSVFEIFVPLTSGGKVVIARDALELPELPAAEEVHLVNTVPSAIAELLRVSRLPRSVRTVNLAGEPLAESLVQEILVAGGVARVFDLYGPTEDTTYSTCAPRTGKGRATIGRPLSNKRAYILDSLRQPVPVGVAGDLYVAGAGVARGYLDRPELTAERFLNDPFRAGARMYSTGDRARFLPDGNIQFLGRLDHQVKVRGFRIEIGEIEEALSRHPAIRAGAVVPHGSGAEKRLVAYLVAHNGNPPSAAELRAHLKTTLPDYMVPSVFLFLDALPLTPNGKIDRRALPAPDSTRPLESGYEPPRNPTEEAVAAIWSEVLRIDRVGIHDNFFELGGHSLVATLVFARLQKAFPDALSLRSLFEKPTVAELASALTAATRPEIASLHSNPIVPVSRRAMGTETAEEPEPKGTRSW